MAADIGKVSATFTSNTSGLRRGVQESISSLQRMENSIKSLRSGLSTLSAIAGAQLFGQIAGAALRASRALVSWGQASAEAIDKTSKLASRMGLTYKEMASLEHAADLAGVGVDQLAGAMDKGNRAFVEATRGNKQAAAAFDRLGLELSDLQGLTDYERFNRIADAIAALRTPAERAAAAMAIFGRSGAALIPLLGGGSNAIRQAADDVEQFGLGLTNLEGTNVEAMNDAFTRASAALQGMVDQVVAYLSPAIKEVVDIFTNFVAAEGGGNIGEAIGEGILKGALTLAQIADEFISGVGSVWEFGRQLVASWNATWDLAGRVFSFFSGIVNSFQAGLGFIILGFGAIAEGLVRAASAISDALGLGTFDSAIASTSAFNEQIMNDMIGNANAAANDFSAVFADTTRRAADALPGPFESAVIDGIAAAREARASLDESIPREIEAKVNVQQEQKAVQGIESTSKEGVKEMFRLMRGGPSNVDEQQLGVLEEIRDGIEDWGGGGLDDLELVTI